VQPSGQDDSIQNAHINIRLEKVRKMVKDFLKTTDYDEGVFVSGVPTGDPVRALRQPTHCVNDVVTHRLVRITSLYYPIGSQEGSRWPGTGEPIRTGCPPGPNGRACFLLTFTNGRASRFLVPLILPLPSTSHPVNWPSQVPACTRCRSKYLRPTRVNTT